VDRGDVIAQRYRLERPIGEGNMGVVWLATDPKLHRTVALKQGSRMRREGVGGAKLLHPNVIAVFDVAEDDDGHEWLVMEYLPSRSLSEIIRDDGPLPPADVARIGTQVASALAHLHDKGMVHRDVTPGNVLVTRDRTAKLTDFGIATWESVTRTEDPKTGGTPGFLSPEVARGNRATAASDVYSLGATLAAAVEGTETPDPALNATLGSLTQRDPDRRPTAEQAARQLATVAGTRGPRVWWLVSAAALVVLALVLWAVHPFRQRTADPTGTPAQASLMGDPRTADPCALTYANALSSFGEVGASSDYGNFNRCDAFVYLSKDHQDFVDVSVEFDTGAEDAGVPVQKVGAIGIQRPPDDDDCERILLLPGDYQTVIDANETGDEKVDLCGMAEAVTSSALVELSSGHIARRTLPAASLAQRDACSLLDTATVTSVLGTGTVQRDPGFGNWRCDWSYTGPILVKVIFDRTASGTSETDGAPVRLGGYDAIVQPQGYSDTDCLVSLVYRTYVDPAGERTDEVVLVDVDDSDKKPEQLCAPAKSLATTVAGRLYH
jgi:hypothetical protein